MKKILFVSSEAVPYVKTGGLADVVGSLPKYFDKKEYDVRVVIPKYACMDRSFLPNLKFLCHFYVNLNWRRQYVGIFESEYHGVRSRAGKILFQHPVQPYPPLFYYQ